MGYLLFVQKTKISAIYTITSVQWGIYLETDKPWLYICTYCDCSARLVRLWLGVSSKWAPESWPLSISFTIFVIRREEQNDTARIVRRVILPLCGHSREEIESPWYFSCHNVGRIFLSRIPRFPEDAGTITLERFRPPRRPCRRSLQPTVSMILFNDFMPCCHLEPSSFHLTSNTIPRYSWIFKNNKEKSCFNEIMTRLDELFVTTSLKCCRLSFILCDVPSIIAETRESVLPPQDCAIYNRTFVSWIFQLRLYLQRIHIFAFFVASK